VLQKTVPGTIHTLGGALSCFPNQSMFLFGLYFESIINIVNAVKLNVTTVVAVCYCIRGCPLYGIWVDCCATAWFFPLARL